MHRETSQGSLVTLGVASCAEELGGLRLTAFAVLSVRLDAKVSTAANWTKDFAATEGGNILNCWCESQGYVPRKLWQRQSGPFLLPKGPKAHEPWPCLHSATRVNAKPSIPIALHKALTDHMPTRPKLTQTLR